MGGIPADWSETQVSGGVNWVFRSGGANSNRKLHGGLYNALLYSTSDSDHKAILATPPIVFGDALQNAQLTFWHCMPAWTPDQDELRVYYKTSAGGTWALLETYKQRDGLDAADDRAAESQRHLLHRLRGQRAIRLRRLHRRRRRDRGISA